MVELQLSVLISVCASSKYDFPSTFLPVVRYHHWYLGAPIKALSRDQTAFLAALPRVRH